MTDSKEKWGTRATEQVSCLVVSRAGGAGWSCPHDVRLEVFDSFDTGLLQVVSRLRGVLAAKEPPDETAIEERLGAETAT
jgi:hypothetical protein